MLQFGGSSYLIWDQKIKFFNWLIVSLCFFENLKMQDWKQADASNTNSKHKEIVLGDQKLQFLKPNPSRKNYNIQLTLTIK